MSGLFKIAIGAVPIVSVVNLDFLRLGLAEAQSFRVLAEFVSFVVLSDFRAVDLGLVSERTPRRSTLGQISGR